jgi:hypothetical protein
VEALIHRTDSQRRVRPARQPMLARVRQKKAVAAVCKRARE